MRFRIVILVIAFSLFFLNSLPVAAQATIIVTSTADNTTTDGACTLREAITNANNNAATFADCVAGTGTGTDTIQFAIAGAGPHTIALSAALPSIGSPIFIDGLSQTGADCQIELMIVINGAATPASTAITLGAGSNASTVRGLVLQGFTTGIGIGFNGSDNSLAQCNFIGTNSTGTAVVANNVGVFVLNGSNDNIIGTDGNGVNDADEGNIISGNAGNGITITGAAASGNRVAGNLIGTDISGTVDLGNGTQAITILTGANNNIIGTNGDGNGDAAEGNLISGNTSFAILMNSNAINNRVAGNFIGTDITGTVALANGAGISIQGTSTGNIIGTNGDGVSDALERNIISGNAGSSISLLTSSSNTVIAGNLIGTDVTGMLDLGNNGDGISYLTDSNRIGTNGDGISDSLERNIISGNAGIGIRNQGGSSTTIAGNYIGTNISGTGIIANSSHAIQFTNNSANNIIGTNGNGAGDASEGNLISGNGNIGIFLNGAAVLNNRIAGNLIGTDVTGTIDFGNSGNGMLVQSGANAQIIGTNGDGVSDALEGNLISGNGGHGLSFSQSINNSIAGNKIGTNLAGTTAIANLGNGVAIDIVSTGNIVGTDGDGISDALEGNLISGNGLNGIASSGDSPSNIIAGNRIGTNLAGTGAIANGFSALLILGNTNRIGTDNNGTSDAIEMNLLSGNTRHGIFMSGSNNTVTGNIIGLDISGTIDLGNGQNGISIELGGSNNTIGGASDAESNIIAGNTLDGINVTGASSTGNIINNNYIGTNAAQAILPNSGNGIDVNATGTATTSVLNNWIFYHPGAGIVLSGAGALGAAGVSEQNCLMQNAAGVNNLTGVNTFFENNWWGTSSGPSGAGAGTGDSVSANVDFIAFLTVPPTGCPGGLIVVTATDPDAAENPLDAGEFTFDLGISNTTGVPITINYTITGTATNGSDYSTIAASIDVPNGANTVTFPISTIDDFIAEGAETVIITLTGSSSTIPFDATPATVTITSDDVAGVTINPLAVSAAEGGTTSYTVVLDSEPDAGETVTITVTISGAAAVDIASTSSLTFNFDNTNWDTPQQFDITLNDDLIVNGNRSYVAAFTHASDSSLATSPYDAAAAMVVDSVDLEVLDNESPNVIINPTAFNLIVGNSQTYDVSLTTEPASDVTISLTQLDANCTISTTTLTFTNSAGASPWNVVQQVTVTAVGAGGSSCTIQNTPTGGGYTGVAAIDVVATLRIRNTPPAATPVPSAGEPEIAVFDPAISKLGELLPGQTGIVGEELEWVVTVSNVGTVVGTNVTVTDTLIPALQIDSVDAPGATVTIVGQTVTVVYPSLAVGQTVQFSIFTTVLQGVTVENTVCVNATNQGVQECASAISASFSQLPSTGESPFWRYGLLAGIGLVIVSMAALIRKRKSKTA